MKRRLLNILSALSLLLCVGTVALWVRSYWVSDTLTSYSNLRLIGAGSVQGRLAFVTVYFDKPPAPRTVHNGWASLPVGNAFTGIPGWRHAGFGVESNDRFTAVYVPLWFTLGLSAILLPMRWLWLYRQRRIAERKGLCPKCGYDLRATPDRCPECGTAVIVTEARA